MQLSFVICGHNLFDFAELSPVALFLLLLLLLLLLLEVLSRAGLNQG